MEDRDINSEAGAIALVSDGSAVCGLGNIGGREALPTIKVKAALISEYGGIDAVPLCLDTQETCEIVNTVKHISPSFGGVCLADISAPRCFEIEKRLKEELDIPAFHDNQHGTAIATGAAAVNALKLSGKDLSEARIVINGAGTVGNAIARLLCLLGARDVVVCDSKGIISAKRISEFGEDKLDLLELTNMEGLSGGLDKAIRSSDVFIGASAANALPRELIRTMRKKPAVFALASPVPEISPEDAKAAGAYVVCTGLAEYPNMIGGLLVTPGIFKGALEAGAKEITDEMKTAAALALAGLVSDEELSEEYILPPPGKEGLAETIAKAAAEAWK